MELIISRPLAIFCLIVVPVLCLLSVQPEDVGENPQMAVQQSAENTPDASYNGHGSAWASPSAGSPGVLPAEDRMFVIKPQGYVDVASYTVPGYYTVLIFSAEWCVPCQYLRTMAPEWLRALPNLVVVDLDVGTHDGLDASSSLILTDFDQQVALPAALFFNPFGVCMNAAKGASIPPPISGADMIEEDIRALDGRAHKRMLDFPATKERFQELKGLGGWRFQGPPRPAAVREPRRPGGDYNETVGLSKVPGFPIRSTPVN